MNSNVERKAQGKQFYEVVFLPDKEKAMVEQRTTILEATALAGVYINSLCGGEGLCGKCKLKVRKGEVGTDLGIFQYSAGGSFRRDMFWPVRPRWKMIWRSRCLPKGV